MSSPMAPALDVQQTTGQDKALAKIKAGEGRNPTYEKSQIKVEGSDTGQQEGQGRVLRSRKDNKVDESSSDSSQAEEGGDWVFSFETSHRIARGAMKSEPHPIQPVGDPEDRTNLDNGKWKTKSSIDEHNTKDIHHIDAQVLNKSSRWKSPKQGSDGSIARRRPPALVSAELRLDCRG